MEYLKTKLELVDGIKSSKIEDKIAKKVTKFYTNKPFPNYKIDDDKIASCSYVLFFNIIILLILNLKQDK